MILFRLFAASLLLSTSLQLQPQNNRAHAQSPVRSIDIYLITKLHEELLELKSLPAEEQDLKSIEILLSRIADQRLSIRTLVEEELNGLIKPKSDEETLDPERALDRQRNLVGILLDRLKERKVDLDLLLKEEKIYKGETRAGTGTSLLTGSYTELLARKLILEERVGLLKTIVETQEKRLKQLQAEQRKRDLSILINIFTYIAIFIAVFWFERMVRLHIFARLPFRMLRYAVAKAFSLLVYLGLFFLVLQNLFTEHPNVLAALALVGAATVISMQDIFKGIAGWLTQQGAIRLGERITVWTPNGGMLTGDVVDIGILHTTLLLCRAPGVSNVAHVGKTVRIPNVWLLLQPVLNYHSTSDYVRVEMPVKVPLTSDWKQARSLLESILKEETEGFTESARRQVELRTRSYYFPQELRSTFVCLEMAKDGVLFTLSFLAPMTKRRATISRISERILDEFPVANLSFLPTDS